MGSSDGGGGGGNPDTMFGNAAPMPDVPIAGQGGQTQDPFSYGQFQNFLPEIPGVGKGPAPSATGLTAEMFQYAPPGGAAGAGAGAGANGAFGGAGGLGGVGGGPGPGSTDLRNQLAALQRPAGAGSQYKGWGTEAADPQNWWNPPPSTQTANVAAAPFLAQAAPPDPLNAPGSPPVASGPVEVKPQEGYSFMGAPASVPYSPAPAPMGELPAIGGQTGYGGMIGKPGTGDPWAGAHPNTIKWW